MNSQVSSVKNIRLISILIGVTLLLLIPLIAMQFSSDVKWGTADFMIAGILLYGTGLSIELVMRKVSNTSHRIIICAVILVALFLVWAELAVGIFGSPIAGS